MVAYVSGTKGKQLGTGVLRQRFVPAEYADAYWIQEVICDGEQIAMRTAEDEAFTKVVEGWLYTGSEHERSDCRSCRVSVLVTPMVWSELS